MIVVYPSPKLTGQEKQIIATSLGYSSQEKSIENNSKRIMTRLLKCYNEKNLVHIHINHPIGV